MHKTRSFRSWVAFSLTALPLLALPATLSGCGFRPLYGTQGAAGEKAPEDELRRVYVANIPERTGQLVRLALQERMAGAGPENPDGYTLRVTPAVGEEYIDIHGDNTSGRVRTNAHAHWALYTVAQEPVLLAQGDASDMDGYTNTFEQYFAQSLNRETVVARVAQALAEQITQQVSIWFRTHTQAAIKRDEGPKSYYPAPSAIPDSEGIAPMDQEGADAIPNMATGRDTPNAGSL
ncbi:lipoprotein [Acetobacter orientalis]|uniref:Lipoprotein n=1 Tax=Acetobacter orientalis TaxID=146474 RepID=A0A252C3W4_9PROT|nr:lipoprotein [Acetobacter orientalis]MCP1215157.1 hypothetical protein [Acetobacter orientalis]MCP1218740.1 hypothetical protein [Acetobacter orientalis]OUJ15895.1 lipoprotein [Acetobacter orientalis]BBC80583.1 lipoprotein [Acetobacter orientalis]GAN64844.1 hypothetical protein Abor_002_020 [Acetobacter orientalis]